MILESFKLFLPYKSLVSCVVNAVNGLKLPVDSDFVIFLRDLCSSILRFTVSFSNSETRDGDLSLVISLRFVVNLIDFYVFYCFCCDA